MSKITHRNPKPARKLTACSLRKNSHEGHNGRQGKGPKTCFHSSCPLWPLCEASAFQSLADLGCTLAPAELTRQKILAGCECHARTSPDMKAALLLLGIGGALWLSGCASNPDDPDQVKLGPSIQEQRKDAKKTEEFAKSLPKPHE
jgi:hypothetical protein